MKEVEPKRGKSCKPETTADVEVEDATQWMVQHQAVHIEVRELPVRLIRWHGSLTPLNCLDTAVALQTRSHGRPKDVYHLS